MAKDALNQTAIARFEADHIESWRIRSGQIFVFNQNE